MTHHVSVACSITADILPHLNPPVVRAKSKLNGLNVRHGGTYAIFADYSVEALLLELQMLDGEDWIPGETLTGMEKRYRTQWLIALYIVLSSVSFTLDPRLDALFRCSLHSAVPKPLSPARSKSESLT